MFFKVSRFLYIWLTLVGYYEGLARWNVIFSIVFISSWSAQKLFGHLTIQHLLHSSSCLHLQRQFVQDSLQSNKWSSNMKSNMAMVRKWDFSQLFRSWEFFIVEGIFFCAYKMVLKHILPCLNVLWNASRDVPFALCTL